MKKTKKTIFSALSVAALSLCAAGVFGLNAAEKKSANAEAGAEESTQTSFQMLGASIRYTTDEDSNSGIRFGISMSKTEWETYRAKTSLETGIILIPETVIGNKTEITLSTEKAQINATYNDAINAWNEDPNDDTLVRSTVVLTKIPVNDYNNVIWARGYLKYTEDGAEKVVYTETVDRSIDEVAYQLLKTETDATKKAALQAYLDANEYTVTIKDEIGNKIDSQKGNYGDPLKTPQKISDDDAVYQFTSWKEENAGYIKGNAEYVANFKKVTAFENVKVTVTDAAKFGLNGVAFTLTNKSNSSIVYNVTVADGKLAIPNAEIGTYSVKAVLIPGTTTTGADITINAASLNYDASSMFRGSIKSATSVSSGENNSITMPSGGANYGCGTLVDAISGNVFVGAKIKFTNDEMVAMINSGNDSGLGIAMFTATGDNYTGIQFWAIGGSLALRTMQNWGAGAFVTLGTVTDNNFTVTTTESDWIAVANAIVGDGIYLVQQKGTDNKLTYYFYNADKTTLLKKYETGFAYDGSDTLYAIGTYRWNTGFAYTVSDFRVGTSLAALGVTAE